MAPRDDIDDRDEAPPFGARHGKVPPEPERRQRTRARTESKSSTKSATFDAAAFARAVADAHSNGAAQSRMALEGVQAAFVETLGQLGKANALIATLQAQLVAAQCQNPTLALLQAREVAESETKKVEAAQRWQTVREVAPKLIEAAGPQGGQVVAWIAQKFGGPAPDRAVAQRVIAQLCDGSEASQTMLAMLQRFVEDECKEDFADLMQCLVDAAGIPGGA